MKYTQNCIICKKEILCRNKKTLYCSDKCGKKGFLERKQKGILKDLSLRTCEICNKKYLPTGYLQKYCSKNCYLTTQYKKNIYYKLRFQIMERDNFTCQYCGRNPKEDKIKIHIDHIYPKSKGGKDTLENLITSCVECNLGKSNSSLKEEALVKNKLGYK